MTADQAFATFPVLTTRRLVLREARPSDVEAVLAWKSDPEVTHPYGVEPYRSLDEAKTWIDDRLRNFRERDGLVWIVADREGDRAIGSACYWHFDRDFATVELGYEMARARWRQGITTEAVAEILRYGFRDLGLHRIEACPFARNEPSVRLLRKLGFVLEGTLRERVPLGGRFEDQLYFGLLETEWSRASAPAPP
jgi:[ribosomal protein S5]-alanine N-acetyltransferase